MAEVWILFANDLVIYRSIYTLVCPFLCLYVQVPAVSGLVEDLSQELGSLHLLDNDDDDVDADKECSRGSRREEAQMVTTQSWQWAVGKLLALLYGMSRQHLRAPAQVGMDMHNMYTHMHINTCRYICVHLCTFIHIYIPF